MNDFIPRASSLFLRMIAPGVNRATLTKQIEKCYPAFGKTHEKTNINIMKNT